MEKKKINKPLNSPFRNYIVSQKIPYSDNSANKNNM